MTSRRNAAPAPAGAQVASAGAAGPGPASRGRLFDDFAVGQVLRSPARTVTASDVAQFAGLSGDRNPLHTDETLAAAGPHRGRIAHGMLVQSIATGLAHETGVFDGTVLALESVRVRFEEAVRPGDTLHVVLEVLEVDARPAPRRGRVRFGVQTFLQDGRRATEGEWTVVLSRRAPRRRTSAARSDPPDSKAQQEEP